MGKNKKITAIIIVFVILAATVAAFALNYGSLKNRTEQTETEESVNTDGASKDIQDTGKPDDNLLRVDSQGNVEIGVTFINPKEVDSDYMIFETQFSSHSVNLDDYDLSKTALFKTSEGNEVKEEIVWEKDVLEDKIS